MSKQLRVTGQGRVTLTPDVTRVTISLEGLCPDYSKALTRAAEEGEALRALLTPLGFEGSDLKTLNFSVDPEYERYLENVAYRNRLIGYRFHHRLKVEFDSDNERLGRLLFTLAGCTLCPEIRLSYTVKDPEAARNALLGRAVADAKAKAAVLAAAAGVPLGPIEHIDYSWGEVDFTVRPLGGELLMDAACAPAEAKCIDLHLQPDDLTVTDSVTVIWMLGV